MLAALEVHQLFDTIAEWLQVLALEAIAHNSQFPFEVSRYRKHDVAGRPC